MWFYLLSSEFWLVIIFGRYKFAYVFQSHTEQIANFLIIYQIAQNNLNFNRAEFASIFYPSSQWFVTYRKNVPMAIGYCINILWLVYTYVRLIAELKTNRRWYFGLIMAQTGVRAYTGHIYVSMQFHGCTI